MKIKELFRGNFGKKKKKLYPVEILGPEAFSETLNKSCEIKANRGKQMQNINRWHRLELKN